MSTIIYDDYSPVSTPFGVKDMYFGFNLFDLYTYSMTHYNFTATLLFKLTYLKACIACDVVKSF